MLENVLEVSYNKKEKNVADVRKELLAYIENANKEELQKLIELLEDKNDGTG